MLLVKFLTFSIYNGEFRADNSFMRSLHCRRKNEIKGCGRTKGAPQLKMARAEVIRTFSRFRNNGGSTVGDCRVKSKSICGK